MEGGIWAATLMLIAVAVIGSREIQPAAAAIRPSAPAVRATPPTSIESRRMLASTIVESNPFRLERKPAAVVFSSTPAPVPSHPGVARRPALLLSGVFGPPWQAVLEGIPEKQGSVVVRVGDVYGDLRIRSIRRDTVVVQGTDTTWKLTVRKAW